MTRVIRGADGDEGLRRRGPGATTGSLDANRHERPRRAGKWLRVATDTLRLRAPRELPIAFTVRVARSTRARDHRTKG